MTAKPADRIPVVIVSGLSGAGKSSVLNVFEDMRFFTADGIPAGLAAKLVEVITKGGKASYKGVALGMVMNDPDAVEEWEQAVAELMAMGLAPVQLFIEATTDVLMRRYASTRRPHPLAITESDDAIGLEKAIEQERELMSPVRSKASLVLDTSQYTIHDLRRKIQSKWQVLDGPAGMRVHIITFGFKYGIPAEADMMFDLRFLPNPYFDPELRALSGKDRAVYDYVLTSDTGAVFADKFLGFLTYLLPQFQREGRYRVTIAIGCTGGRHRSVSVAELAHRKLNDFGFPTSLEHRHLELG